MFLVSSASFASCYAILVPQNKIRVSEFSATTCAAGTTSHDQLLDAVYRSKLESPINRSSQLLQHFACEAKCVYVNAMSFRDLGGNWLYAHLCSSLSILRTTGYAINTQCLRNLPIHHSSPWLHWNTPSTINWIIAYTRSPRTIYAFYPFKAGLGLLSWAVMLQAVIDPPIIWPPLPGCSVPGTHHPSTSYDLHEPWTLLLLQEHCICKNLIFIVSIYCKSLKISSTHGHRLQKARVSIWWCRFDIKMTRLKMFKYMLDTLSPFRHSHHHSEREPWKKSIVPSPYWSTLLLVATPNEVNIVLPC